MPDPIRPEDHNIDGVGIKAFVFPGGGEARRPEHYAFIEAIHQTFERDAADSGRFEDAMKRYEALRAEGAEHDEDGDPLKKPERRYYLDTRDPDTEIDRQARLIVDGEYRRRQTEGGRDE